MKNPSFVFNSDNELVDVCLTLKDVEKYKNKGFTITKNINHNKNREFKVKEWKPKKKFFDTHVVNCEADEIELKNKHNEIIDIRTKHNERDRKLIEEKKRRKELSEYNYCLLRILIKVSHNSNKNYFNHNVLIDGDLYLGNVIGDKKVNEITPIICLWDKKDDCFIHLWFDNEKPYFSKHKYIDSDNTKSRFKPIYRISDRFFDYMLSLSVIKPIKENELKSDWYLVKTKIARLAYYNSFDKLFYIFYRDKKTNNFVVYKKQFTSKYDIKMVKKGTWQNEYNITVENEFALPVCCVNDLFFKMKRK